MDKKNKQLKLTDAQQKHECICWDKEKGCKCLSRGYASACICCKFHNKKLPRHFTPPTDYMKIVWIQSHYPNRFYLRGATIKPQMPYESNYKRMWCPSGAIRSDGQEILYTDDDGYD